MIYRDEFTVEQWCEKIGLDNPRLNFRWGRCEKCIQPVIPLRPFQSKNYAGFESDGLCPCGHQNEFKTSSAITITAEEHARWSSTLSDY